jgi:drebrin-like protein
VAPPRPPTPEPEPEPEPAEDEGSVAIALYDYAATEENELSFAEGDRITHIEAASEEWWNGRNARGEIGLLPGKCPRDVEDWGVLMNECPANYVELQ